MPNALRICPRKSRPSPRLSPSGSGGMTDGRDAFLWPDTYFDGFTTVIVSGKLGIDTKVFGRSFPAGSLLNGT